MVPRVAARAVRLPRLANRSSAAQMAPITRIEAIQSDAGALLTPAAGSAKEAKIARPATMTPAPITSRRVITWPVM